MNELEGHLIGLIIMVICTILTTISLLTNHKYAIVPVLFWIGFTTSCFVSKHLISKKFKEKDDVNGK